MMIGHQRVLIRRELWEHPAIYITPLVIGLIVLLVTLTGQVSFSAYGEAVNIAIVGAQSVDEQHRATAVGGVLAVVATIFSIGAWIVMIFYSLDALYTERKDKSILFWRSLPITDAETVVSKLITALFVIPFVTVAAVMLTQVLLLAITSVWVMFQGGDASHLVWAPAPLADAWFAVIVLALALPLWLSPLIGWFLFASAFTKRSPLLLALLPIIVLPLLEKLLIGSRYIGDAIWVRSFRPPIINFEQLKHIEINGQLSLPEGSQALSLSDQLDISSFLVSPSLWAGLVVCGLLVTAAIYVRRYRDESY
ncbi:MAG TPA: ABC-2 transporter permease [Woeseiaceae bacterium]|nr:ABC-2 transporter permease [Woeseiaceae bacterium]